MRLDHVERGLENLQRDFPLQARISNEPELIQRTYTQILRFWIVRSTPPSAQHFPEATLRRLIALDAVVSSAEGLGAYPFSAKETSIRVAHGKHRPTFAMCAVDALAIPLFWKSLVRLESRCHACGVGIELDLGPCVDSPCAVDAPFVFMHFLNRQTRTEHPACSGLCTAIYFLCPDCARNLIDAVYTLQEAQCIGQMFFAFQTTLLQAFPERPENGS